MGTAKKTVLVVDNEPFNVDLVTTILTKGGFVVKSAGSGDEALKKIKRSKPDLVLMDLQLPGMDGLEATRTIVSDPETKDVKVVAFSALAMPSDRARALKAGCVAYITKPVGARQLIDHINELLL
ncbi:MAG: response regulator [Actinomycetota bacterium]|nr:response regulator [Actinomycetota bacterium]